MCDVTLTDLPMLHDHLYWCYTEVRARHIADWLGVIKTLCFHQVMAICFDLSLFYCCPGRRECIPMSKGEKIPLTTHKTRLHSCQIELKSCHIQAKCPNLCTQKSNFLDSGGHDRVFVSIVAAPLPTTICFRC